MEQRKRNNSLQEATIIDWQLLKRKKKQDYSCPLHRPSNSFQKYHHKSVEPQGFTRRGTHPGQTISPQKCRISSKLCHSSTHHTCYCTSSSKTSHLLQNNEERKPQASWKAKKLISPPRRIYIVPLLYSVFAPLSYCSHLSPTNHSKI